MTITRRTPLRRSAPLRAKRRKDPVTASARAAVLARDGACVLARLDDAHVCRDAFGRPHYPTAVHLLTIEHVKSELRAGKRAPSDLGHMVALCAWANGKPPSKDERALLRLYLESAR